MDLSATTLLVGVIAGAIGYGYYRYGRKQERIVPLVSGIALCVYPYFVESVVWLIAIGVVLAALPFVIRR